MRRSKPPCSQARRHLSRDRQNNEDHCHLLFFRFSSPYNLSMNQGEVPPAISCPQCGSLNVAEAEKEFSRDYPFSVVLILVFVLFGLVLFLFFLLQLHPVILILVLVAGISWLLKAHRQSPRKKQKKEFICLDCEHRFREKLDFPGK